MNATQRIRLGLLLTNLKLGGRFSFRTFVNDKDYPKDPDPKNWRTINGSKVHLTNGKIDGGAGEKFQGNEWHGKVAHGSNSHFPPKGWVKPPPPPKEPPKAPEPDPFTPEVVSLPKKQAKVGLPGLGTHYANMLKGSYKNATHMVKGGVDDAFKQAGKMHSSTAQKGVFIDMLGLDNSSDAELAQKVFEAAKNKQITPLAAKNVMAALASKKHSLVTNSLKKELGMQGSAAAPAATPPVAKSATTATVTYNDLTNSEKDDIYFAKLAVSGNNMSPSEIGALHLNNPKKEFAEMAVALTEKYNANPTPEAQKDLNDKLAQIYKGQYKASKEDIDLYKEWKNSSKVQKQLEEETIKQTLYTEGPKAKAAGLMQTPGTSSVDTSETATGIKQAPGTLNLFAKKGSYPADPAFENFADYQEGLFKKLKPAEKKGILRYTQGSTHLRDWLVYGREDPDYHDHDYKHPEYVKNGMTGKAMQKVADNISAGLKKMKHPAMWVSRAGSLMDWATNDNPGGLTLADLKKMAKSGEVFENKAFLSSSPLEKPTFSLGGTNSVCRYIYTPEEASGGYIDSGSHYSSKKGSTEYEFLLDKKTKTRIMKVEEKNGVIYTYEEVVV